MSRGVAEGGLLMTETSFLPSHLIGLVYPLPAVGGGNLVWLAMTNAVFMRDLRGVLLSPFLDTQNIAKESGVRSRSLLSPLLLAVAVSFVASCGVFLSPAYNRGELSLCQYPHGNANNMFTLASTQASGPAYPGATKYGGFGVGLVVTVFSVDARDVHLVSA